MTPQIYFHFEFTITWVLLIIWLLIQLYLFDIIHQYIFRVYHHHYALFTHYVWFTCSSLKALMGGFNVVGESFCNRLTSLADGKTMLTMAQELNRVTLDAIGKVCQQDTHYNDVIMAAIMSQITSRTIVYSIVYWDADQRKHQSSASLAFVRGIHRGTVNSPRKWPVTWKMFPFDDVIMYIHCGLVMPLCDTDVFNH